MIGIEGTISKFSREVFFWELWHPSCTMRQNMLLDKDGSIVMIFSNKLICILGFKLPFRITQSSNWSQSIGTVFFSQTIFIYPPISVLGFIRYEDGFGYSTLSITENIISFNRVFCYSVFRWWIKCVCSNLIMCLWSYLKILADKSFWFLGFIWYDLDFISFAIWIEHSSTLTLRIWRTLAGFVHWETHSI